MWYVRGLAPSRWFLFCRQLCLLTLLGHFTLITGFSLHAGADSLVAPNRKMVPPSPEDWQECHRRAAQSNESLENCNRHALRSTHPLQRKENTDDLFSLYGAGNLLFFRSGSNETSTLTEHAIAGPHTQLQQVSELTMDLARRRFT
jgi:hypothetical protein